MSAPTSEELQLVEIFRQRLNSLQLGEHDLKTQHLLRWIRAREGELDKAEVMIRTSFAWRKSNGIGPSLLAFRPPTLLTSNYPVKLIGFDKEGSPILSFEFGRWDLRRAVDGGAKEEMVRYKDQILEQIMTLMRLYEEWGRNSGLDLGAKVTQFIAVSDWEGFSLKYIMRKEVVELILDAARSFEANYPETLKAGFNINCPKVFAVLFNLIKPFLTERTLSKIKIFDSNANKWRPELEKFVVKGLLPKKYGGTRDDNKNMEELHNLILKEGDVQLEEIMKGCKSIWTESSGVNNKVEKIDPKDLVNVRVAPGYKYHVPLKSTRVGDRFRWYFRVEDKDISFSVVGIRPSGHVLERLEVVGPEKVEGEVSGSHICEMVGDYALCFDNTYSTFKAKMVGYKVTMDNPFTIN